MEGNGTITSHNNITSTSSSGNYAKSGKVMLTSVIITFSVVIIIVFFHSYARCIFLRRHRRRLRLQSSHPDPASSASAAVVLPGLDSSIVKNLPTFLHSVQHDSPLECAVCLSEFEEQEEGRILPACGHKFHAGCIDMWFFSHSNCPLCRSSVVILLHPESLSSADGAAKNSQDVVSISVVNDKGSSSSSSSSSEFVVISVEQPPASS